MRARQLSARAYDDPHRPREPSSSRPQSALTATATLSAGKTDSSGQIQVAQIPLARKNRLFKQGLNRHIERLGDGSQLVVENRALTALDFRNLRLVDLDALPRQPPYHVLLRDFGLRVGNDVYTDAGR